MYGKAKTYLIRLSGVLSIFSKTIALLKLIPESKLTTIEEVFQSKVKFQLETNKNFIESIGIVGIESLKQAEILVTYFNGHRVILANYHFNLNTFGAFNLNEQVTMYLQRLKLIPENIKNNKKFLSVVKRILLFDGQIVNNSKLCKKHHLSNEQTEPAFKYLENVGFGTIEIKTSANKKKVIHFNKISPDELKNDVKLTGLLDDLDIQTFNYTSAYNIEIASNYF